LSRLKEKTTKRFVSMTTTPYMGINKVGQKLYFQCNTDDRKKEAKIEVRGNAD